MTSIGTPVTSASKPTEVRLNPNTFYAHQRTGLGQPFQACTQTRGTEKTTTMILLSLSVAIALSWRHAPTPFKKAESDQVMMSP